MKRVVHYELLDFGQTITAEYYQQQFIRLSNALERKKPYTDTGSRQVIFSTMITRDRKKD